MGVWAQRWLSRTLVDHRPASISLSVLGNTERACVWGQSRGEVGWGGACPPFSSPLVLPPGIGSQDSIPSPALPQGLPGLPPSFWQIFDSSSSPSVSFLMSVSVSLSVCVSLHLSVCVFPPLSWCVHFPVSPSLLVLFSWTLSLLLCLSPSLSLQVPPVLLSICLLLCLSLCHFPCPRGPASPGQD